MKMSALKSRTCWYGRLPLHVALVYGLAPEAALNFIKGYSHAAQVNDTSNKKGLTPLQIGIQHGTSKEVIAVLLHLFPSSVLRSKEVGWTKLNATAKLELEKWFAIWNNCFDYKSYHKEWITLLTVLLAAFVLCHMKKKYICKPENKPVGSQNRAVGRPNMRKRICKPEVKPVGSQIVRFAGLLSQRYIYDQTPSIFFFGSAERSTFALIEIDETFTCRI